MYEKKARPEENPTTFMGLYLAIDPKYQGKGIGTELLRQAEHLSAAPASPSSAKTTSSRSIRN